MDATLDLSRWRDVPRGLGYRRWTMVSTGLRHLLRTRLFRILVFVSWGAGLALAAMGFLFSQSVASGGWLETLASYMGARQEAFASALGAMILLYPDVCIGGWYTLIFWAHSHLGLGLSLIALTAMVPRLITRDRATNALIVYMSRPLTSADYLIGKLGMIVGVIALMWTGPLLLGWALSVAFAPNMDFIVHSIPPLGRALLFHGIALVSLAAISLGVSALGRNSRMTTVAWIGLWLILGVAAKPPKAPQWIKRASFVENLGEVRQGVLRLDTALITAGESLPVLDPNFSRNLKSGGTKMQAADFNGALASLGAFLALSSFVFLRRLKPE